jgi:beta-glucosidase
VLAGFAPVDLAPGESQEVMITVRPEDLAYWDRRVDRFVVEGGSYTVAVGASSRDLRLTGQVTLAGDGPRIPLTMNSTIIETLADPVAGPLVEEAFSTLGGGEQDAAEALGVDLLSLIGSSPIGRMVSFSGGEVTREQIEQLLAAANAAAG